MLKFPLLLASQSPRRKELLKKLGFPFDVQASDIDEVIDESIPLDQAIEKLAYHKALELKSSFPNHIIISADTVVVLDNEVLGKPKDEQDAINMLTKLSGKKHQVITGLCLLHGSRAETHASITDVYFSELSDEEINAYVKSGQAYDKAGAYGIQDEGAFFIHKIDGDYYTVMGLPIALLKHRLIAFNDSL